MQKIIIFGASGHGSVVLDCIQNEAKYKVIGFVDSFKKKGTKLNGYEVLGSELDLPYLLDKYSVIGGLVAIGDNWLRRSIVERIQKIAPDFRFITAIHPYSTIGLDVEIGDGTVIMPGVIINANTVIGNHCILNTNASLDHDGFMYNFTSLAPRVCIGGNLILGECSAICLGANIIENITVGKHTVVGAGSLVVGNIGNNVLAYGAPAKKIRNRVPGEPYLSGTRNTATVIPLMVGKR
ncbi:MAG: acetyltransferase [Maribacter sp.]|nr:acetyltransferase [Maribacter sp.]